jgi:predicted RNA-binding protein YlxR (DUF448 family)
VSSSNAAPPGTRVRTCVGCRQRAATLELLRVVAAERGADLEVVPDPARRAAGRGAHLHPTPDCLALALRRRAFPRALRTQGSGGRLDTTALEAYVAGRHEQHQHGSTTTRPRSTEPRNWSSSS